MVHSVSRLILNNIGHAIYTKQGVSGRQEMLHWYKSVYLVGKRPHNRVRLATAPS